MKTVKFHSRKLDKMVTGTVVTVNKKTAIVKVYDSEKKEEKLIKKRLGALVVVE